MPRRPARPPAAVVTLVVSPPYVTAAPDETFADAGARPAKKRIDIAELYARRAAERGRDAGPFSSVFWIGSAAQLPVHGYG